MEFLEQFVLATMATVITLLILSSTLKNHRKKSHKKQIPEAGGAWPILGHLRLIGSTKVPHRVLATLADTYGPIFTIRLGGSRALVVSSSELARDCLITNDMAVFGRPPSVSGELISYNYAVFGFAPYGPYWRLMRKIVMSELLSNHRFSTFSHVWESEVKMFVSDLYALWGTNTISSSNRKVLVDLKQKFADLGMNIIVRLISGKKFGVGSREGLEFHEAIRKFFDHIGSFAIGDALPFLRWMDIGGQEKAMKRNFKKLDSIIQAWLEEHKQNRAKVDQDFMDVMLSVLDDDATKDCNHDPDTINKANCLNLIAGGSDTIPVTLTWAVTLLVKNPDVLKRAQDELATQVGKDRQVEESDIPHLIYLQAIIKETLRLYPTGPLLSPRQFSKDCAVGDYHIEVGTRLIVNLHKIFRDPKIWEDPLEFRPERFLTTHKDVDVRGNNFEFIPFGAGRRTCPGISFGLRVVHLALASLLHAFELGTSSSAPIDMGERFGLTSEKVEPLEVLIAPILSSDAYMS